MVEVKKPIYMKWWVWILIFLLTAVVANYATDVKLDYVIDPDIDAGEIIPYQIIPTTTAATAVVADYHSPVTFLIGDDFPAGEYFVIARTGEIGYLLLSNNRSLTTEEVTWQMHFEHHTFITLIDGMLLTTKNATLIPVENAVVPTFENNILTAGTYRVGIDIPVGVYKIFPTDDQIGFFATANSSREILTETIQARNFSSPITIALNDGDYFVLLRGEIRK